MSWPLILALGVAGLFLSAFFSGSEIGFYRATRLRLVLDAMGDDRVSRGLFWLTNHPSVFVATTLVGNNLANYLASLAIVLGTQALTSGSGHAAELIVPLLFAPILFVYGELLPKNLFLEAPNRLLRRGGPLFLVFVVLFFPVSLLLQGINRLLTRLVGASFEEAQLGLARRELSLALEEGHQAGVLYPAQRDLAQGIFWLAQQPVGKLMTPLEHAPRARADMSKPDVLRLAARHRVSVVPIEAAGEPVDLDGYVRVVELGLSKSEELGPVHPLPTIRADTTHLDALIHLQSIQERLARVVDAEGSTVGLIDIDRLREPLLPSRGG